MSTDQPGKGKAHFWVLVWPNGNFVKRNFLPAVFCTKADARRYMKYDAYLKTPKVVKVELPSK